MKNSSKIYLKPIGGDDSNAVAKALKVIAIIEWISSVILFFVFIENIAVALAILASGIISGIFIMGFAEIIRLLQLKQTQEYIVITEETVKKEIVKDKVVESESMVVKFAEGTTERISEHTNSEKVSNVKKEEIDHMKIVAKLAAMNNMVEVQQYMIGYFGYKDEIFRKMLLIAHGMAETTKESSDEESINKVREFLAIYRAEVANK